MIIQDIFDYFLHLPWMIEFELNFPWLFHTVSVEVWISIFLLLGGFLILLGAYFLPSLVLYSYYTLKYTLKQYQQRKRIRQGRAMHLENLRKQEADRVRRGLLAMKLLREELAERNLLAGIDPLSFSRDAHQECLAMLLPIKEQTHCTFAKKSAVWTAYNWRDELSLEENFLRSVPTLLQLTLTGQEQLVDGFVFYCPASYAATIPQFGDTMATLLWLLNAYNPSGPGVMEDEHLGRRGWRYSFNRTNFFITSFGPCYGPSNPRFTFGQNDWAFILFQPEFSFSRHSIGGFHSDVRHKIRTAFSHNMRPFWVPESPIHYPFVWNFISPPHPIDPLVLQKGPPDAWWERRPTIRLAPLYTIPDSIEPTKQLNQ